MSPNNILIKAGRKLKNICLFIGRNYYTTQGEKVKSNQVNLEWVSNGNLGDELAPVIYDWMLEKKGIDKDTRISKTIHLMSVGSMVGSWEFDSVIWGSGIHIFSNINKLVALKNIQKLDIRAVRGPITRNALESCGYVCPETYGDPAVLMPLIYMPDKHDEKQKISVVLHYRSNIKLDSVIKNNPLIQPLNIATTEYMSYIQRMLSSKKVISSSLHGIILAESYGIPAVFLNTGGYVENAFLKYYDWYYATGRYSVKVARSLEEAINMSPMPLPDLGAMQENLLRSFPYDLWL